MGYKKETKTARKLRLQEAGKWREFVDAKKEARALFLQQGMTDREAAKEADKHVDSLYTPYGTTAEVKNITEEQQRRRSTKPQPKEIARVVDAGIANQNNAPASFSVEREIRWVHHNLMVPYPKIEANSVPSGGAVALLDQAKGDYKWFYEKFYSKLIVNRTKDEAEDETDDVDPAEVESMIDDLLTPTQMEAVQS